MKSNGVFSDLKVVELATVLAGPAVGLWFAEMGAEVIKVENPSIGGDVTRHWKAQGEEVKGKVSAYFASVNALKKHLWLDLRNAGDVLELFKLLESTDVLIVNFKHGDEEKFGLSYTDLKEKFPRLIYAAIRGFRTNPARVAYDVVIQAECGFMSMNGEKDSEPLKMPIALMDILAANQLKEGILTALLQRSKSGKGVFVHTSLEDSALAALVNQGSNFLMNGKIPQRMGSLHPNIAPYGEQFICADGTRLVLAVGSDTQFSALCKLLGAGMLAMDERFSNNAARVNNREALQDELRPLFSKQRGVEIYAQMLELNIPVGMVKDLQQVLTDPAHARRILESIEEGIPCKRMRTIAFEIKD
jgi:crotonobetainyl-CoA:carnitine CoA-transferase CaiB-like acyl-CoA transferase